MNGESDAGLQRFVLILALIDAIGVLALVAEDRVRFGQVEQRAGGESDHKSLVKFVRHGGFPACSEGLARTTH